MKFATASFTHVTIHNSSSKAHTLHFTLSTSGSLNWTSWLTLAKLSYSKFHFVVATNATWQLSPKTPCTWQHLRFTLYTIHSRYNSISKKTHSLLRSLTQASVPELHITYLTSYHSHLECTTPSTHLTPPRLRTSEFTSLTSHCSLCISHPCLATRLFLQVSPRTAHTFRL